MERRAATLAAAPRKADRVVAAPGLGGGQVCEAGRSAPRAGGRSERAAPIRATFTRRLARRVNVALIANADHRVDEVSTFLRRVVRARRADL